jgi:hypothetical protein
LLEFLAQFCHNVIHFPQFAVPEPAMVKVALLSCCLLAAGYMPLIVPFIAPALLPLQPRQGSIIVSAHGPAATIIHKAGLGTATAHIRARVTLQDLQQDCLDNDIEGSRECSMSMLTRRAAAEPLFHASANCPAHTLTTDSLQSQFAYRNDAWVNLKPLPGEDSILDGSEASGASLLDEQFRTLCPTREK